MIEASQDTPGCYLSPEGVAQLTLDQSGGPFSEDEWVWLNNATSHSRNRDLGWPTSLPAGSDAPALHAEAPAQKSAHRRST